MTDTWVVEAKRYGSELVVDKRVYTDLTYEAARALHQKLYMELRRDGTYYWHSVRSFDEEKLREM
jgi:hypothetical protein